MSGNSRYICNFVAFEGLQWARAEQKGKEMVALLSKRCLILRRHFRLICCRQNLKCPLNSCLEL